MTVRWMTVGGNHLPLFEESALTEELRRWRVQLMAEQLLIDQIRAREQDPRAFVRITSV